MKTLPFPRIGILIVYVLLLFGCSAIIDTIDPSPVLPTIPDAFYTGTVSCIPCHDEIYQQYTKTVHFRISQTEIQGKERGCETCHGPGSKHIQSKGALSDTDLPP